MERASPRNAPSALVAVLIGKEVRTNIAKVEVLSWNKVNLA